MSATTRATLGSMTDERIREHDRDGLYSVGWPGIRRSVVVLSMRSLLLAASAVVIGTIVDRRASGESIERPAWWLGGLVVGAAVFGWLWPRLAARTEASVEGTLRGRILGAVISNPSGRFRTGEIINRATEGAAAVSSLAGRFLPQLIGGIIIPLLICGVVAMIDVPSALILVVSVPAIPLLLRGMEKRFTSVTTRYRETADRLTSEFLDGIQGMGTLRAIGRADDYAARLQTESERLRSEAMALLRVNQLALLAVDSLFTLGTVVAAGAAALWRLSQGAISVGDTVAIVILGVALIEPISQIGRFFYVGAIGRAAAKDVESFLADSHRGPGLVRRVGDEGWVRLEDVSFSYGEGPDVLDSVSLQVEPGEVVALVGASGVGKTTLARLVTGLLRPDAGLVDVGGRVAMVSQQPFLFHGTLRENLRFADPDATDLQMRAALAAADLGDLVNDRDGLDLQVGERGLKLSGGEAQRLTIARMLLTGAPVVVLDEPTSNVDIETEARIRLALDRLTAGKTVILIAHRRSTLAGCDRVVAIGGGTITETTGVSA